MGLNEFDLCLNRFIKLETDAVSLVYFVGFLLGFYWVWFSDFEFIVFVDMLGGNCWKKAGRFLRSTGGI